MPRKAPDGKGVTEHRITLGDYERKLLTKQLNEDDVLNKASTYAQVGKTVGITAAVVGGTVAAATLGTLALAAYREAADLVDQAQDMKATAWTFFKYRIGAASFDEVINEAQEYVENEDERKEESNRRKNMGFLEFGLDRILVFLLGEDKKWTGTTLVTEDEIRDLDGDGIPDNVDPDYEKAGDAAVSAFDALVQKYGSIQTYYSLVEAKREWLQRIDQFCLLDSPDYDAEICQEVTQDYQMWQSNYPEI